MGLFFLLKGKILCQDIKPGRLERLKRTLKSYINDDDFKRLIEIRLNEDVSKELFDKVKKFIEIFKKIFVFINF